MLYDTLRTSNFSAEFFEPEYWRRHDAIEGTALGRGTTWFIRSGDSSFVLRHYRRGGLMAKLSKDAYLWRGEAETRSFAEWYLTYHLHRAGLPVPAPIAARYRRRGPVLPCRPHHPAHRKQRIAGGETGQGSAVAEPVDCHWPLHPSFPRCGRTSRRSQRAQHPADSRAGLPDRFRSRHAAQTRLVGGHHAGAAVPLAGEGHAAGCAARVSPTRTGIRCSRVTANPPDCRKPR